MYWNELFLLAFFFFFFSLTLQRHGNATSVACAGVCNDSGGIGLLYET